MLSCLLQCILMHVAVFCSGTYKVYVEMTEHIERDLQKFHSVTNELTCHLNKVRYRFSCSVYDWSCAC